MAGEDREAQTRMTALLLGDTAVATPEADEEEDVLDAPEAEADDAEGLEGEEADEDAEPEDADAAPAFTVLVDGKEVEVTADEARNGYLRQADYSRKTQAVAEERKAVGAELQQLRQERLQYAEVLPQLVAVIRQEQVQEPPDDLAHTNPAEYVRLRAQFERQQARVRAAQEEQARVQAQIETDRREHLSQYQAQQVEELLSKVPEWKDKDTAAKEQKMIRAYGMEVGLTAQEVDSIMDHRFLLVLRDAARFRSFEATGKAKIRERATTQKGTLPPQVGAKDTPSRREREQWRRIKERGGKDADVAPLMGRILTGGVGR